jgi:hypothetical protein
MKGMVIKPIRLRSSLYLLVPYEVAQVTEITENTKFVLKLIHGNHTVLRFEKIKEDTADKEKEALISKIRQ